VRYTPAGGKINLVWRGFDGGQDARAAIDAFFAMVDGRSKPAIDWRAPSRACPTRDRARR
jgi:hypothetical protein